MANRLFDLKQTPSTFQIRGKVNGVKNNKFYSTGSAKNGNTWSTIRFGVLVNEGKPVYVELTGYTGNDVFFYKKGENGAKGITKRVAWNERKKTQGDGFRLIGINVSTSRTEDGQNVNEMFTDWDTVEYLHENLKDGDSVLIRGNMVFDTYMKNDVLQRKVVLNPTQISYTQRPIDFGADNFAEEALFDDVLVFTGIEKETDENDMATGRFVVTGYSVKYNDIVPVQFIIEADHAKLAGNFKKKVKPYSSIKVWGKINVVMDATTVESEVDDGWGETSRMEQRRMNAPIRTEYVLFKADPNSIDTMDYSEKSIADALKAIKNAKEATQNFTGKSDASTDSDGWGADDDDDEEAPWD